MARWLGHAASKHPPRLQSWRSRMRENEKPILKCAIYTRKSSEEGLEQDFNSLHAQREACEAYIKSQKHEGWVAVRTAYDDGGYSGGSMDRPALRQLLDDIRAKHVDVVVVYKVDRLTRQLGSVNELAAELKGLQLRTRAFTSAGNKAWGDRPFSRGHIYKILGNPIYAGKIAHKEQVYEGLHEAIIDKATWDLVQAQLASSTRKNGSRAQAKQPSLLAGLLVDDQGSAFTCSHAVKDGKRYRYYVRTRHDSGASKPLRIPAHDIEAALLDELKH